MRIKLCSFLLAVLGFAGCGAANAQVYFYNGVVTLCTGTCDSFASLDVGAEIVGGIEIDVGASDSFGFADVGTFEFEILNPGAPLEPYNGTNPTTANPLPITPAIAPVVASGGGLTTGGTTDGIGELSSGSILFEFVVPPFNSNGAWIVMDIGSGGAAQAQICLFFPTAGCIPGATQAVVIDGSFSLDLADSDGDGVYDDTDNCRLQPNPDQRDTNGDGIGNICDADVNDDCVVNFIDLGLLKTVFFTSDPDADFDGNGTVNVVDLGIMKSLFFAPPGPSGIPNNCSPD